MHSKKKIKKRRRNLALLLRTWKLASAPNHAFDCMKASEHPHMRKY
jgi:hypothetical protein